MYQSSVLTLKPRRFLKLQFLRKEPRSRRGANVKVRGRVGKCRGSHLDYFGLVVHASVGNLYEQVHRNLRVLEVPFDLFVVHIARTTALRKYSNRSKQITNGKQIQPKTDKPCVAWSQQPAFVLRV